MMKFWIKLGCLLVVVFGFICCSSGNQSPEEQPPGDDTPTNMITYESIIVNQISDGFHVSLAYSGDENSNASVILYYCAHESYGECDPVLSGEDVNLTLTGDRFECVVGNVDPGNYTVRVLAEDADGVFGFPLETEIVVPDPDGGQDVYLSPIDDLSVDDCTYDACTLSWTAPGLSDGSGSASLYDLRYSKNEINSDQAFETAAVAVSPPTPLTAGGAQVFSLTGLDQGATYYFALKSSASSFPESDMSNVATGTTLSPTSCGETYVQEDGDGWAAVGNFEDRNTYRGVYWTGESKQVCFVEIELRVNGVISDIAYEVSVWRVDINNDLSLDSLIATSDEVSGQAIMQDSDGWITFDFQTEVPVISGNTAILLSRSDAGNYSENYVAVSQNYDEDDLESRQWNIHYYSSGAMAGRSSGDEDQPEYFACNMKLFGSAYDVESSLEYPNMPEDIMVTPLDSGRLNISWHERGKNSVAVDHYNIYEYDVSSGLQTLIGSSSSLSYIHEGLDAGSTHAYTVRAVTVDGNEGYHSLDNGANWQSTTLP